jgi:hypothetical protein
MIKTSMSWIPFLIFTPYKTRGETARQIALSADPIFIQLVEYLTRRVYYHTIYEFLPSQQMPW